MNHVVTEVDRIRMQAITKARNAFDSGEKAHALQMLAELETVLFTTQADPDVYDPLIAGVKKRIDKELK